MNGKVSSLSMACMVISCVLGIAIPLIVFIYLRKKKNADVKTFFIGCLIFFVFAMVFEGNINRLIFNTPFGETLNNNIWLYALFGGFMAGLFEEVGRFFGFQFIKEKMDNDYNALMYGAGHGGMEMFLLFSVTMINNLIFSSMINSGSIDTVLSSLSGNELTQMEAVVDSLVSYPAYMFIIGIFERIFALMLHMALSVLVWFSVKDKSKRYLFFIAILIHMFVDAASVLMASFEWPIVVLEGCIFIMALATCLFAKKVWDSVKAQ